VTLLRSSTRKLRAFRPEANRLENLCPVSALAFGLVDSWDQPTIQASSTSESTVAAQPIEREPARSASTPFVVASVAITTHSAPAADQNDPISSTHVATAPPQPGHGRQTASDLGLVDLAKPSIITVSAASHPAASPAGAPSQPRGAVAAAPSTTPPAAVSTPPAPAPAGGDIRPMTLAPTSKFPTSAVAPASGGSGGGPPLTQEVMISSGGAGKHKNAPASDPVPWVIEGSYWGATPILTGTGAAQFDWPAVSWTWSFPMGALKGYGTFDTVLPADPFGDASGQYDVLHSTEPPNEDTALASAKPVTTAGFTTDDLAKVDPAVEPSDHVFNGFYFGPATVTGSPVRVTLEATFRSHTAGVPDFTGSDYVEVNVAKPTGNIALDPDGADIDPTAPPTTPPTLYPEFGTAGVSAGPASAGQRLQLDANFVVSGGPHGIDWKSSVDPTATGIGTVSGRFAVTQTMTYMSSRTYNNRITGVYSQSDGLIPGGASPGVILDSLHYPGPRFSGGGITAVGGTPAAPSTYTSNDSPGTGLDTTSGYNTTPMSLSRSDSFTMTLMFQPAGGIWVPVGKFLWSWNGSANWRGTGGYTGVWFFAAGTQASGAYAPTSTFPEWTYAFNQVANNWQ